MGSGGALMGFIRGRDGDPHRQPPKGGACLLGEDVSPMHSEAGAFSLSKIVLSPRVEQKLVSCHISKGQDHGGPRAILHPLVSHVQWDLSDLVLLKIQEPWYGLRVMVIEIQLFNNTPQGARA